MNNVGITADVNFSIFFAANSYLFMGFSVEAGDCCCGGGGGGGGGGLLLCGSC